ATSAKFWCDLGRRRDFGGASARSRGAGATSAKFWCDLGRRGDFGEASARSVAPARLRRSFRAIWGAVATSAELLREWAPLRVGRCTRARGVGRARLRRRLRETRAAGACSGAPPRERRHFLARGRTSAVPGCRPRFPDFLAVCWADLGAHGSVAAMDPKQVWE